MSGFTDFSKKKPATRVCGLLPYTSTYVLKLQKTLSEGSNCSMSACYLLWTNHTQRDGNIIPKR